ncbi:MAG: hypothetical protein ACRD6W_02495 [Nitrososphaerales archaeon]
MDFQFGDHIHADMSAALDPEPPPIRTFAPIPEVVVAVELAEAVEPADVEPVLVFGGKNWRLASPKKWVPASLDLRGCDFVDEMHMGDKVYWVFRLTEGFAAKLKPAAEAKTSLGN